MGGVAASRRIGLAAVLVALVLTACGQQPSPDPTEAGLAPLVIGCASIEAAECAFVVEQITARLPANRGQPFAIEVTLYGCENPVACPRTLAVRAGMAMVEYADGGEPIQLALNGPPQQPHIEVAANMAWSGLIQPSSERVAGAGPFHFEVGHCGLSHVVDFDGSFWLPIGQIDGDASGMIGSGAGMMSLLGPNVVVYQDADGFSAQLARFPGPKRFWLCA